MPRIILFILVILLSGAGIAYLSFGRGEKSGNLELFAQLWDWGGAETEDPQNIEAESGETNIQGREFSHENGRYTNTTYGFSFSLPPAYEARASGLGEDGEVLTFDAGTETSFQIFIMLHDEPAINEERIRIDLPDLVMKHVREGTLADTEVLVFNSFDSSLGDTYEVWFVRGKHLYQIMTYADNESVLNEILGSWGFL